MCTFKNKTTPGSHIHCFCTCPSFQPSFRQMSGQITSIPVLLSTLILNNNSEGFHSDISMALQTGLHLCNIFQHLTQEEYKKFQSHSELSSKPGPASFQLCDIILPGLSFFTYKIIKLVPDSLGYYYSIQGDNDYKVQV